MQETLCDLEFRLACPAKNSTAGKLTSAILKTAGARQPLKVNGTTFNNAAEQYYRNELRLGNFKEALDVLKRQASELDSMQSWRKGTYNEAMLAILQGKNAGDFVASVGQELLSGSVIPARLEQLIYLTLLVIEQNGRKADPRLGDHN